MGLGEIEHMDVIPNAGAVCGVVIITKDRDALPLTRCYLQDQRDQMSFGVMMLAPLFTRATRVEISEASVAQPFRLRNPR